MNHPLDQAASLVEAFLATLNTTTTECPCCGLVKYDDFDQFRQHTELKAVVAKLNRIRGWTKKLS